jgi:hypothetical protein
MPPEIVARFGDPEKAARRATGHEMFERARAEGHAIEKGAAVSYALSDDDQRDR